MRTLPRGHASYRPMIRSVISLCALSMLAVASARARGPDYPWVFLTRADDSLPVVMRHFDEAVSLNTVSMINLKEEIFEHRLVWKKAPIKDLLSLETPFCELHFDAVKPFRWSAGERSILAEYFKRGGFTLFFMDAYPYTGDEVWGATEWPVI